MRPVNEVGLIRLVWLLVALGALLVGAATDVFSAELMHLQRSSNQNKPDEQTSELIPNHIEHNNNNGQDVAAVDVPLLRRRRSSLSSIGFPVSQLASLQAYQPRDRFAVAGHELSDLITQAHRDKQAERRLMKLLINFKLASDLDDIAYPISANRLMFDDGSLNTRRSLAEESAPVGDPQLEALDDESEQMTDELGLEAFQLGKRKVKEYIKPCMFNAVSCAKNPFRKY